MKAGLPELLKWVAVALAFLLSGCKDQSAVNVCASGDMQISNLELTIDGEGLFTLGNELYTRKGAFCVAKDGHILHESGQAALIYAADGNGNITGARVPAVFNIGSANGAVLQRVSVTQDGEITGHYTAGRQEVLGQFALGTFNSPQNLLAMGDNLCAATPASGGALMATPGTARMGGLKSGVLEGSYECDRGSLLFNVRLQVNGEGYFVLTNGSSALYTKFLKIGSDAAGYLVNEDAHRITGNNVGQDGNLSPQLGDINLSLSDISPRATSTINPEIKLNELAVASPTVPFNAEDSSSYNYIGSVIAYDSLGTSHTVILYFSKTSTPNIWNLYTRIDDKEMAAGGISPLVLTFDSNGIINAPVSTVFDIVDLGNGANPLAITFDYSSLSQASSPFDVVSIQQDGYAAGRLVGVSFSPAGLIFGAYSNGRADVTLGRFLLASWAEVPISMQILSPPGTNGLGLIALKGSH